MEQMENNVQLWMYKVFPYKKKKENGMLPGEIREYRLQDCAPRQKGVTYKAPWREDEDIYKSRVLYEKIGAAVHPGRYIQVILDHRSFHDAVQVFQKYHDAHYKRPCDYSAAEQVPWETIEEEIKKEKDDKAAKQEKARQAFIEREKARKKDQEDAEWFHSQIQNDTPAGLKIKAAVEAVVNTALNLQNSDGADPGSVISGISVQAIYRLHDAMKKGGER